MAIIQWPGQHGVYVMQLPKKDNFHSFIHNGSVDTVSQRLKSVSQLLSHKLLIKFPHYDLIKYIFGSCNLVAHFHLHSCQQWSIPVLRKIINIQQNYHPCQCLSQFSIKRSRRMTNDTWRVATLPRPFLGVYCGSVLAHFRRPNLSHFLCCLPRLVVCVADLLAYKFLWNIFGRHLKSFAVATISQARRLLSGRSDLPTAPPVRFYLVLAIVRCSFVLAAALFGFGSFYVQSLASSLNWPNFFACGISTGVPDPGFGSTLYRWLLFGWPACGQDWWTRILYTDSFLLKARIRASLKMIKARTFYRPLLEWWIDEYTTVIHQNGNEKSFNWTAMHRIPVPLKLSPKLLDLSLSPISISKPICSAHVNNRRNAKSKTETASEVRK